jgi:cytochrome b6-f complex iron-sulfur subunit
LEINLQNNNEKITRRSFFSKIPEIALLTSVLSILGGFFWTILGFMIPSSKSAMASTTLLDIDGNSIQADKIPNNSGTVGIVGSKNILVINREGKFIAMSAVCTHLGCIVKWNKDTGDIRCPCHGGTYDLSGKVIGGPPPANLKLYDVKIVDGNIILS